MLKFLLSFIFSTQIFAQVQSLPEYNRNLFSRISVKKKPLNRTEFKALRIRLGAELSSADDKAHKQMELTRLLQYVTYSAFLSKDKAEEALAKDMWNNFLNLPNSAKIEFPIENIFKLFDDKNSLEFISFVDYQMKIIPKKNDRSFFLPLIWEKCEALIYMRKTSELKQCWKLEAELGSYKPTRRANFFFNQLGYYFVSYSTRAEFELIAKQIVSDEELMTWWPHVKRKLIFADVYVGQLGGVEASVESIRRADNDVFGIDRILFKYYMASNRVTKALEKYKSFNEPNAPPAKIQLNDKLSSELYFRTNDYEKSLLFINKIIEAEDLPLLKMTNNLIKLIILTLNDSKNEIVNLKIPFENCKRIMEQLKIEDDLYRNELRAGMLLTADTTIEMVKLAEVISDFKKSHHINDYAFVALRALQQHLIGKAAKTIVK